MIHYLNPNRFYSNRAYLTQWFLDDTLVVTDNDFENVPETIRLLSEHSLKNQILDITHNPWFDSNIPIEAKTILTNNFEYWYNPKVGVHFFPLFLWMYSLRTNLWWTGFSMDAGSNKTQKIMCLNNRIRPHREYLFDKFRRRNLLDRMMYTFIGYRNLPNELPEPNRNDVGVDHPVYHQYAVNLVTETETELTYVSEKTCKPFIARQIPIIVSSAGVNKFLQDTGLDMFEDLVPWHKWDNEIDAHIRMQKIVEFVEQWIYSGTILNDYQRVINRVERNKQYFHSEAFRNRIMNQMSQL
jgi:hypothetical protein